MDDRLCSKWIGMALFFWKYVYSGFINGLNEEDKINQYYKKIHKNCLNSKVIHSGW